MSLHLEPPDVNAVFEEIKNCLLLEGKEWGGGEKAYLIGARTALAYAVGLFPESPTEFLERKVDERNRNQTQ